MKAYLKKTCAAVSLSLLTIAAYADTTTANRIFVAPATVTTSSNSSLPGSYQCKRIDAANVATTSTLTIAKSNQSYTFEWDDDSGNPILFGSGVMNSSMANLIAVAFSTPKDANSFGVELFNIKPDGSLDATWVLQSSNKTGSETCTKK